MAYQRMTRTVFVSDNIHKALKILAAHAELSISNYCDGILLKHIQEQNPKFDPLKADSTADLVLVKAVDPAVLEALEKECEEGLERFIEQYRKMFKATDPKGPSGQKIAGWEVNFRKRNGMEVGVELEEAARVVPD